MDIMGREFIPDFTGEKNFQQVGQQHQEQGRGINDNLVPGGETQQGTGNGKPENDHSGIHQVHKITGQGNLQEISFPVFEDQFPVFIQFEFFKIQKVNAEEHQQYTACDTNRFFKGRELEKGFGENGGKQYQGNIAGRYTKCEGQASLMPVTQALFDNGKKDRADGKTQQQTEGQPF